MTATQTKDTLAHNLADWLRRRTQSEPRAEEIHLPIRNMGRVKNRPNYGTAQRVPQNVPHEQLGNDGPATASAHHFTGASIEGKELRPE